MDFPQGARETILNEIVCRYPVARQRPRVARQARDQDLDLPVQVIVHRLLLPPSGRR
jgi:hypothetical protein